MANESIRGYRWMMTYRGFDIYFRGFNGYSIAYLSAETAARATESIATGVVVPATQFDFGAESVDYSLFDEFWASYGA